MWTRRQFLASSVALAAMQTAPRRHKAVPLIDSHVHVWKRDHRYPFAPGAAVPPEDATIETLLELMHDNGVAHSVIIQVIHYRWDNSYLADVLKRYPRIFQGVCRVNPQDPSAPDQLSRLTEYQGFSGVRLSPAAGPDGDWIRGPLMAPLWRRCAQLKVPMTLLIPVIRLPDLHPHIEANPDLQVVIDHMADSPLDDPRTLQLLLNLAQYPHVFVKISHMWSLSRQPYPYPDAAAQVQKLLQVFGAERLMAATDWPICLKQLSYRRAVDLFRSHLPFLTPKQRQQVLEKTAQRVWPF